MSFILLFVALNQTPAQLGEYNSYEKCNVAIRAIYTARATPKGTDLSQKQIDIVNKNVTSQLQYQREFICVAK